MRKFVALMAAVLMGLGMLATVAVAAESPPYPPGAAVRCNKGALPPGDFITCSADGFQPGRQVTVKLAPGRSAMAPLAVSGVYAMSLAQAGGQTMGTPTADSSGTATLRFQIPPSTPDGPATITFEGPDANGDFQRIAVATVAIDSTLPATGAEGVDRWAAIAGVMILLGGAFVLVSRRKKMPTR